VAERGLVVSKPDDLGVSELEVRNQLIRAVVGRFRQIRILPPPFYVWAILRLRIRRASSGFIEPCLPSPATRRYWIHEIKHDGYRLMARRDAAGTRSLRPSAHRNSIVMVRPSVQTEFAQSVQKSGNPLAER
jgi:hypothetical protein